MNVNDIKSVEGEAGVIATLIQHPTYYFYVEELKPEHFTDPQNQIIYLALSKLAKRGIEKIDALNVLKVLGTKEATKQTAQNLTIASINEMIDLSLVVARNTPEEYKLFADDVLNKAFRRGIYQKLQKCEQLCLTDDGGDLGQKIYAEIDETVLNYNPRNDLPLFGDIVDKIWEGIKARQRGNANIIEFPFPELNQYVVIEPKEVICFAAVQKAGKSAMLLTCTVDMLKKGKSVLYVDSEISDELFTKRILSHLTGIEYKVIRDGLYTEEQEKLIDEQRAWLKTRKFIHVYTPVLDENTLLLAAKRAKHLIDVDCCVLDYLKPAGGTEAFTVYAELGNIADCFKNRVCGDLGICGLTAAQATKYGQIADSARIGRSVSTVVAITNKTKDEIRNDGEMCGNKKMRVVYNRNGAQMADDEYIDVDFKGDILTYRPARKQHDPNAPY